MTLGGGVVRSFQLETLASTLVLPSRGTGGEIACVSSGSSACTHTHTHTWPLNSCPSQKSLLQRLASTWEPLTDQLSHLLVTR